MRKVRFRQFAHSPKAIFNMTASVAATFLDKVFFRSKLIRKLHFRESALFFVYLLFCGARPGRGIFKLFFNRAATIKFFYKGMDIFFLYV